MIGQLRGMSYTTICLLFVCAHLCNIISVFMESKSESLVQI